MAFDWGILSRNHEFMRVLRKEIVVENSYFKFFKVEEGDVVLDVGASAGLFTFSILQERPKKVYCFEPHKILFRTLEKNVLGKGVDVTCLNAGVCAFDGKVILNGLYNPDSMLMWSVQTEAEGINFSSFVKSHDVDRVDFMKLDCEGCEYDVFEKSNIPWILRNVKKTAGEWHLHNEELKMRFRIFRDDLLRIVPDSSYEVLSMDGEDIKSGIWTEEFVQNNECIMLYIRISDADPI